jgi:hypothetical protein
LSLAQSAPPTRAHLRWGWIWAIFGALFGVLFGFALDGVPQLVGLVLVLVVLVARLWHRSFGRDLLLPLGIGLLLSLAVLFILFNTVWYIY